jgi:large subunit ribosomal protein L9
MAAREVILRDDVPTLGRIGDVVRVRPGYARNYLFPRGLAVAADRQTLRQLEHQKRVIAAKADRERKSSEGLAAKLNGLPLILRAKAGEGGRLFGSVTKMDLERRLADIGHVIDRRHIFLETPIKVLGEFPVEVEIGLGVRATIQVTVAAETETD